jgi:hypothetical protein
VIKDETRSTGLDYSSWWHGKDDSKLRLELPALPAADCLSVSLADEEASLDT